MQLKVPTGNIRKVAVLTAAASLPILPHPHLPLIHPTPTPMKALRGIVGSRPSSTPEPQPSTSAVFPSLRKLDLPMDQSHDSPLLTLNLSAPSFLDAVVKDEFSDSPLYIIETHRDRTGIFRCETENITSVAKVQWPSRSKIISANAVALSGISIQIHGGRWRPAEEFLKFGSLFTYVSPLPPSVSLTLSISSQFPQVSNPASPSWLEMETSWRLLHSSCPVPSAHRPFLTQPTVPSSRSSSAPARPSRAPSQSYKLRICQRLHVCECFHRFYGRMIRSAINPIMVESHTWCWII